MNTGRTVFSQLIDYLPQHAFRKCVQRYHGDYKVKSFTCYDQFLCLAFAQLTYRESLRDIEVCMKAAGSKLYHMGFRGRVSRNNLAHANETRDWRIFADFALVMIKEARELYASEPFSVKLKHAVYALDATTIDLCLKLFPWAKFRSTKGGVKANVLLDLRGNIPTFVHICKANEHEVKVLDLLVIEAGAFYLVDRGYLDFERLFRIYQGKGYFVTRAKSNTRYTRLCSRPVKKQTGVRSDQTVMLSGFYSELDYPEPLRRVSYKDPKTGKRLVFLTNNFDLSPFTIARLYRARWQVELFFKWLKQHLRIKAFYGTSENAVKIQLWVAVSVYVLVAIVKKRLLQKRSLYTILQIFSINLFEKTPILQVLESDFHASEEGDSRKQLILFE